MANDDDVFMRIYPDVANVYCNALLQSISANDCYIALA